VLLKKKLKHFLVKALKIILTNLMIYITTQLQRRNMHFTYLYEYSIVVIVLGANQKTEKERKLSLFGSKG